MISFCPSSPDNEQYSRSRELAGNIPSANPDILKMPYTQFQSLPAAGCEQSNQHRGQIEDTHIYTSGNPEMALYSAPAPITMDRDPSSPPRDLRDNIPIHASRSTSADFQLGFRSWKGPGTLLLGSQSCPLWDAASNQKENKVPLRNVVGATPICTSGNRTAVWGPNCGPSLSQCHPIKVPESHPPRDHTGSILTWAPGHKPTNYRSQCRHSNRLVTIPTQCNCNSDYNPINLEIYTKSLPAETTQ